jgi:hypothetical protein
MIIRRYRNGVLVSEEVSSNPPPPTLPNVNKPNQTTQTPTAPKKGCGCGSKKKP